MSISNWITTAYLITSTSFQPLYGSFSDALGRRNCLFFANGAFTIGCLACGFSKNIYMLSFMRALTGIGGGGLITLSTIVNSDVIPSSKRGIFQAFQEFTLGFVPYVEHVLGDSTAKAGLRLTIPSLFTPVGSLITGFSMSKYNCLRLLLYIGISLMFLGNFLFLFIEKTSPNWLIGLFLIPANLGQGITFPTTLFTFIFMFSKSDQATATSTLYLFRSIGSVWGVAISAGVIQLSFAGLLRSNLKGLLDENKIKKLIVQLSANSSYIGSLHGEVKNTVIKSFDEATKRAHLMSTLLSLLALILCILKDNLAKPKTRR
ncbi:Major Facilitator Superfamily protein [Saccharomyces cerevisiae]|nr:Major Facilitator Superfamily protein [Saccharomyces cerevisiae]